MKSQGMTEGGVNHLHRRLAKVVLGHCPEAMEEPQELVHPGR